MPGRLKRDVSYNYGRTLLVLQFSRNVYPKHPHDPSIPPTAPRAEDLLARFVLQGAPSHRVMHQRHDHNPWPLEVPGSVPHWACKAESSYLNTPLLRGSPSLALWLLNRHRATLSPAGWPFLCHVFQSLLKRERRPGQPLLPDRPVFQIFSWGRVGKKPCSGLP